ncbi:MAG TPA: M13 family metallopeptidase [Kofleriaceae bacterium]|jgi:predicted metalloendopeptidase
MRKLPILLLSVAAACGGSKPAPAPVPAPPPDIAAPEAPPAPAAPEAPPAPTKPVTNTTLQAIGLDPNAMDRNVDPCDDFYQFTCGNWLATTKIAPDKPVAMRSFVDIQDRNEAYEHDQLEKMAKDTKSKDPLTKQLGAFYASCTDEAAIEKAGLAPLAPLRATIAKVKDVKSLSLAVAQLQAAGYNVLFAYGPAPDAKDAKSIIASVDQGGLGLPDRDYYLGKDAQLAPKLEAYRAYINSILTIGGETADQAKADADAIIALETQLATVSKTKIEQRDPVTMYNRLEKAGVAKAMPSFDWATFWKTVGQKTDAVTVGAPGFLTGIDPLLAKTPVATWKAYLTFHVLSQSANFGPKKLVDARFEFGKALTGVQQQKDRWKRCVDYTDGALPDLLGQVFVRDKFGGDSKTAAVEYVGAISAAMKANLEALPWMDKATKEKAFIKLAKMTNQIGFPNKWRTYSFKIDAKAFGANMLAANKAETARQLAKIGKPDDRDDWYMSAPTVNAYYSAERNGMVFPAGILQTPFYNVASSIPVNLGAMGIVVGHELTHGFDDQGAQYDSDGNLVNWWQESTQKEFAARTKCVVDQYSKYEIAGTKVKGELTQGENIADIGGTKLALSAYRSLRSSSPDTQVADGFTEDQQFFISFGQAWCAKELPDYEKMLATVDPHSPPKWRVNGALQATPDFAKTFRCKAGSKMAPVKACVVW